MMSKYLAKNITLALLITLFLTGCGAITGTTPTPLPTIALDNTSSATSVLPQATGSGVAASGVIVPAKEANMAFASGGIVESIEVVIGAHVDAGQVIARLAGAEQLQASLSTAELEILVAQQNLEKLTTDLPEEQIAALQTLNDARKALRDAELKISGFGVPAEQIDVEVARSNVALAKRALDQALKDFQPYENKLESNLKRAALLSKLSDAQKLYDNAVQQLNRLTGVFVPEFDMSQAKTELEIAQTRLALAEDKYAQLAEGPDPAELELAEARLQNAQDRAQAVRANLANLELKAPFAGVVSQINIQAGEWVIPGQSILALADLDHLRVETTDLSERDIPDVEIGQSVTVQVTALDQEVSGQVTEISPLADTLGGDVVYKTMIDLDTIPSDLRAGMSVEVQFGVTQ